MSYLLTSQFLPVDNLVKADINQAHQENQIIKVVVVKALINPKYLPVWLQNSLFGLDQLNEVFHPLQDLTDFF
jgi:hypothetical protein